MSLDVYRLALSQSGKLKLKATSMFAQGAEEDRFEACVLFHDAARAEERALGALGSVSHEVRLASAIEQCGCLLEGLDPPGAARIWSKVLQASEKVQLDAAASLRSRIDPLYAEYLESYRRIWLRSSAVRAMARSSGSTASQQKTRKRQIQALCKRFPGVPQHWYLACVVAVQEKRFSEAWDAIGRCVRLDPETEIFYAMQAYLAAKALDSRSAEQFLDERIADLGLADAHLCLFYGLAAFELALHTETSERHAWLERARDATERGLSQPTSTKTVSSGLHALRLALNDMLAGRRPDFTAILYRVGLGHWVIDVPPAPGDQSGAFLERAVSELLMAA